jgi:hypothetical protein
VFQALRVVSRSAFIQETSMKTSYLAAACACLALTVAACSSDPAGPSPVNSSSPSVSPEGTTSSSAVTVDRIRLRKVGGPDLVVNLTNGQVIDVPINVALDVWVEVRRTEADRARAVVDWGNAKVEESGCGACRSENIYTQAGRYSVSVNVIDVNAAPGSAPVSTVRVTLNATDFGGLICAPLMADLTAYGPGAPLPFSGGGVSFSGGGGLRQVFNAGSPEAVGQAIFPIGPLTITYDTDRNSFSMGVVGSTGAQPITYQAYSSAGNLVASGSTTVGVDATGNTKGTVLFYGSTFRRVVISSNYPVGSVWFDNFLARCQ